MSISNTPVNYRDSKIAGLINDIRNGHAWLWNSVWLMMLVAALLLVVSGFDHRLINGVDVWDKPAKFFFAVAVQFATVSWALTKLEHRTRDTYRAVYTMVIAGWAENIYISGRAGFGLTSHFNNSTVFSSVAYGLMGLGAVSMTATAFYIGWQIWRQKTRDLWQEAAALGLMIGAVLGTMAGIYMSQRSGHWVGGEMSDAHGLTFFGWSTTGGDLRVAHFVGLHTAQFIPLAALSGEKRVVYGVAAASVILTVTIFVMSMGGIPLFRT